MEKKYLFFFGIWAQDCTMLMMLACLPRELIEEKNNINKEMIKQIVKQERVKKKFIIVTDKNIGF